MTAAALVLSLLLNQAEVPIVCGPDDSACWRRMALQEIHGRTAEKERADAAEEALQKERAHVSPAPYAFMGGVAVGILVVVLALVAGK